MFDTNNNPPTEGTFTPETAEGGGDLSGLFGTDLTNVETERPLLSPIARVALVIKSCAVVPNKNRDGQNLEVTFATAAPLPGVRGAKPCTVNPGFTIMHRISLKPTEKYPQTRILEELKKLRLSCGKGNGPFGQPAEYVGATATCSITVDDKNDEFGAKNLVRPLPPKQ